MAQNWQPRDKSKHVHTANWRCCFYFLFYFIERGREGERETEEHLCERETWTGCLLQAPQPGTEHGAQNCSMCSDLELNQPSFSVWDDTRLGHASQGQPIDFLKIFIHWFERERKGDGEETERGITLFHLSVQSLVILECQDGIEPATLAYQQAILTNSATLPGPRQLIFDKGAKTTE